MASLKEACDLGCYSTRVLVTNSVSRGRSAPREPSTPHSYFTSASCAHLCSSLRLQCSNLSTAVCIPQSAASRSPSIFKTQHRAEAQNLCIGDGERTSVCARGDDGPQCSSFPACTVKGSVQPQGNDHSAHPLTSSSPQCPLDGLELTSYSWLSRVS